MCCEHLICANCSGPVAEGRCSVCRGGRREFGHGGGGVSTQALLVLLVVLGIAVAVLTAVPR